MLPFRFPFLLPTLLALALLFSLLVACGADPTPTLPPIPTSAPAPTSTPLPDPSPSPIPEPSPVPTPTPWPDGVVQLPHDEGIHAAPLEWWYFNGHIAAKDGREFSFHFVTFQSVLEDGFTPRIAHLSWADHEKGLHLAAEQPDLPILETTSGEFDITIAGWHMSGDGQAYQLSFQVGDYAVELEADARKPAVLHDDTGFVDLGVAGKTFYYSRTDLETTGTVSISGDSLPVTGTTWFDHQWGNFSIAPIGWDWLSLNLDDGSDLMVSVVWDQEDRSHIATYGTYVPPDSDPVHLPAPDVSLEPTGSWTSPDTGGEYPMSWKLNVDSLGLALILAPVIERSEFNISQFIPVIYWEGAVSASGAREGSPVSGKGFVEMVGYVPSVPIAPPPTPTPES